MRKAGPRKLTNISSKKYHEDFCFSLSSEKHTLSKQYKDSFIVLTKSLNYSFSKTEQRTKD